MTQWLVGRQVADLSAQELDELWSSIRRGFTIQVNTVLHGEGLLPNQEEVFEFFHAVLSLAKLCIDVPEPLVSDELVHVVLVLRDFLLNERIPHEIQEEVAQVLELWCKKRLVSSHVLCLKTFHYLLATSLHKRMRVSDVKRLWNFHKELLNTDCQSDAFRCLTLVLLKMVQNEQLLSVKEGRSLVTFFLCLNEDLVKEFHQQIKMVLPTCKKEQAIAYGEIYGSAIRVANLDVREVIRDVCLKDLIEHVVQARRCRLVMGVLGQQLMHVLRVIHSNKGHVAVRKMLIEAYEPVIWRFVTSCNNIHRCNAAEVLLDVYPLEHPGGHTTGNMQLLELQHTTMNRLLTDTCHVVRIIATRGVCQIMCEFWCGIPMHWRQKWVRVMLQDLSTDGSSVQVRRGVYRSLSKLLKNPRAVDYLGTMLPKLYRQIHDGNKCVRWSFLELLLHIRQMGLLQYRKVVPVEHLIARLEVEDENIGRQLVSLMSSNFLVPKQSTNERLKRIMKLTNISVTATRNFFLYSKHILTFPVAVELMQSILINLQFSFDDKENNHQDSGAMHYNPRLVGGLLDVVSILWSLHSVELNNSANKSQLMQLYRLVKACYPTLQRCYKDCNPEILGSVLFLGSLVPANVLKLCTASNFCLSHLRSLPMEGNVEATCLMWVSPLCSWGQGAEVLNITMEWLEEALGAVQTEQLASKKVQSHGRSEPLLALHVLDALFCHRPNMSSIMTRDRNLVFELWSYLGRIKLIVEMRMKGPLTSPLLCDNFLSLCFLRYAKLIVLLGEYPDGTFDSCENLIQLLRWAEWVLVPHVPETLPAEDAGAVPLVVKLLQDLTRVVDATIAIGQTNDTLNIRIVEYASKLLSTGCALMFVHCVVCVIHWLVEYCRARHGRADKQKLFRSTVPELLLNVLIVFKKKNYNQETVALHVENMGVIRAVLSEVLLLALQYYGGMSKMVHYIVNICVDAAVGITMNDIEEVGTLNPVKTVRNLPHVAAQLLCVFQQRDVFGMLFVCLMVKRIHKHYIQDSLLLISAICVLHAMVYNPGRMATRDLAKAARIAASALKTVSSSQRGSVLLRESYGNRSRLVNTTPNHSRLMNTMPNKFDGSVDTTITLLSAANQVMLSISKKLGLKYCGDNLVDQLERR